MNEREKFWLRWRMGRGWLRNHLGAGEVPGETDLAGRATINHPAKMEETQ